MVIVSPESPSSGIHRTTEIMGDFKEKTWRRIFEMMNVERTWRNLLESATEEIEGERGGVRERHAL